MAENRTRSGDDTIYQVAQDHWRDKDGNPAGGLTTGPGLVVHWQDGPLDGGEQTGAFVEDLIVAAEGRLSHFQHSRFQCQENAAALRFLRAARKALEERTADRTERGVEGTHQL